MSNAFGIELKKVLYQVVDVSEFDSPDGPPSLEEMRKRVGMDSLDGGIPESEFAEVEATSPSEAAEVFLDENWADMEYPEISWVLVRGPEGDTVLEVTTHREVTFSAAAREDTNE